MNRFLADVAQLLQRMARKRELLRGRLLTLLGTTAGERFGIGPGVDIRYPGMLMVGADVMIEGPGFLHCLSSGGVRIGDNTILARNVHLHCGGTDEDYTHGYFSIGSNCYIGPNAVLGASGGIAIGDNVLFGPNVTISSENHLFDSLLAPICKQGVRRQGVTIESDCWIASGVTVLDGAMIGRGSVIAAGAVVTKSVPPYSVVAGVPGRVIRMRDDGK